MENIRNKVYKTLRWSEKYAQTDMIYVAKGGFWMTFGHFFTNLLSLVLIIAFANLLSKETYGIYKYILSLAGVLNIFTLTGMNSAVSRAVASGDDGIIKTSVKYQLKWNISMLVVFLSMSGYYLLNGDSLLATSFLILGIFTPATLALNTFGSYLEGKKDFRLASISTIVSTFVYTLGVLMAILFSGEIFWLIIAYSVTTFASTLFFYFYTLRKFNPPSTSGKDALKYGRELTFIGFISPISSQIDKIILTHFWGPAQLAVYTLAMAVPERATSFIKKLVGLGFPKFTTKNPEEINTIFYKRIWQGALIGVLAAFAYILIAPYLFKYLLPQYIESILYSQILAISFIFAMPNRYISLLLVSQRFSRLIFLGSMVQSIIIIFLYVVLGIWGGIMGLVIAYVLNSFIGVLLNIFIWRKGPSLKISLPRQ